MEAPRAIPVLTVLIPVRNEVEGLPRLREEMAQLRATLASRAIATEVVITDNHSTDGSDRLLTKWASEEPNVTYVRYSMDVGFQASLKYGMTQARGDALVVLQSDLQDPPEIILDFVARWQGGAKVVAGVAVNRDESWISLSARRVFYSVLDWVSDRHVIRGFQDFYLIDRGVYESLAQGPTVHQFLRGRIAAEFGVDEVVEYARVARRTGHSKFSFSAKYALALDGLLLYGHRFLRLVSVGSLILLFVSILSLVFIVAAALFGFRPPVAGWMSTAAGISAILAVTAGGFGLVLEYLIRIYRILAVPNLVPVERIVTSVERPL